MTGTAERCKEGSQVWSATRDTPGSSVTRGIARSARSTPG